MSKPDKIDMDRMFEDIANGMSVKRACDKQGVSNKTFYDKLEDYPHLKNDYARSRERRAESCIDRIDEIKDMLLSKKIDPQTARILIDTEKWEACKFYPKMYGEKSSDYPENNGYSVHNSHELDIEHLKKIKELLDN